MQPATHIIAKQRLNLRYNGATDALALRQMISRICNEELPVRLNALFDRYDEKDFVVRLDKLDVSLSINDNGHLEEQLVQAIIEEIETELIDMFEKRAKQSVTIDQSFASTLRFYLEHGFLPWWSLAKEGRLFKQTLDEAWQTRSLTQIAIEILPVLQNADARTRLLAFLDDGALDALVLAAGVWSAEEWKVWKERWQKILHIIQQYNGAYISANWLNQMMRDSVLAIIASRPSSSVADEKLVAAIMILMWREDDKQVREAVAHAIVLNNSSLENRAIESLLFPDPDLSYAIQSFAEKELATDVSAETRTQVEAFAQDRIGKTNHEETISRNQDPDEGDRIFISNAGLVIIAPYLPRFFSNLNLVEDGRLKDVSKAIALLRYLVSEQTAYEEFEVVLEKILCGIPLAQSVIERHEISADERAQVQALLQSVIEHWAVLKSTTPAGLRYNFLLREGKLLFKGNQWELSVQKMAPDILLDYLPWNISIIKLPWMRHMLTVKWN